MSVMDHHSGEDPLAQLARMMGSAEGTLERMRVLSQTMSFGERSLRQPSGPRAATAGLPNSAPFGHSLPVPASFAAGGVVSPSPEQPPAPFAGRQPGFRGRDRTLPAPAGDMTVGPANNHQHGPGAALPGATEPPPAGQPTARRAARRPPAFQPLPAEATRGSSLSSSDTAPGDRILIPLEEDPAANSKRTTSSSAGDEQKAAGSGDRPAGPAPATYGGPAETKGSGAEASAGWRVPNLLRQQILEANAAAQHSALDPRGFASAPARFSSSSRAAGDGRLGLAAGSADDQDLPADLPSVGSIRHGVECKPCLFLYHGMCQKGQRCVFCHVPHDPEEVSRVRPSKKTRNLLAKRKGATATG